MSYRYMVRDFFPTTLNKLKRGQSLFNKEIYYVHRSSLSISTVAFTLKSQGTVVSSSNVVPSLLFCRFYNKQGNDRATSGVWRKRLWRILRGVLLTTGGVVWTVAILAYISLEKVNVDVHEGDNSNMNALERQLINHFYKEKDEAGILRKDEALDTVWRKLKQEDRINEVFGSPVYMCGYNYNGKMKGVLGDTGEFDKKGRSPRKDKEFMPHELMDETPATESEESETDRKLWEAGCYIEGPKNVGLMKVMFEEDKNQWVPIALHLETLQKSGFIVTDVSASLPNGLKNFTRLTI